MIICFNNWLLLEMFVMKRPSMLNQKSTHILLENLLQKSKCSVSSYLVNHIF